MKTENENANQTHPKFPSLCLESKFKKSEFCKVGKTEKSEVWNIKFLEYDVKERFVVKNYKVENYIKMCTISDHWMRS